MATLWIREYEVPANTGRGAIPVPYEPGTDQSPVTYSTTTQSAAFGTRTHFITIISDAAFHYVVGTNPTATTNAIKVPADTARDIGVKAGQKIAVIAAS